MCETNIELFKEVLVKRTFLIGMVLILMLFLLPSCAAGVSQEEYDRVTSDLAVAQTQIQSLEGDLTEAEAQIQSLQTDKEVSEEKRAEALAYAEFVDVLLWPAWKKAGITPRFAFEDEVDWLVELKNRASDLGDTKLSNYIKGLDEAATLVALYDYCLGRIVEKTLK